MNKFPVGITIENESTLSFGNYIVKEKIKVNDFEFKGNIYSLRSHNKVTRLEKNGELLLEAVPGAFIQNFYLDENLCSFNIEAPSSVQLTLGLLPAVNYNKIIKEDGTKIKVETSATGKLSFSVSLNDNTKKIDLEKI